MAAHRVRAPGHLRCGNTGHAAFSPNCWPCQWISSVRTTSQVPSVLKPVYVGLEVIRILFVTLKKNPAHRTVTAPGDQKQRVTFPFHPSDPGRLVASVRLLTWDVSHAPHTPMSRSPQHSLGRAPCSPGRAGFSLYLWAATSCPRCWENTCFPQASY